MSTKRHLGSCPATKRHSKHSPASTPNEAGGTTWSRYSVERLTMRQTPTARSPISSGSVRCSKTTLGDLPGAIHAYGRILERDPDHLGALHALQRVADRSGDAATLLRTLDKEVSLTTESKRRASLLYRAAEVLEDSIGDVDGAVRRLREVLEIDPTHRPSLSSLARIFTAENRPDDLLGVLRQTLEVTEDSRERVVLLHKMGELCEFQLGREEDAATYYRGALEVEP